MITFFFFFFTVFPTRISTRLYNVQFSEKCAKLLLYAKRVLWKTTHF